LKGVDVLLRAFVEVSRRIPEAELELGGDGPDRKKLERLSRSLELGSRVKFLGTLSRDEVRQAMWRSHILALASFYETFGVVLIEAMATGLPVVATQCGGPEETVRPESGRLVPVRDADALAGAIVEVHDHWEQFEPARIRACAEQRFGGIAIASRLKALYEKVLKE
jgi:glycosyltransferase involved in cell wall biosynthesis